MNEKTSSSEDLRSGIFLNSECYVAESGASGCGPACVLTAREIFRTERGMRTDVTISVEEAIDTIQKSSMKNEIRGRTDTSSRQFLVEELNKMEPQLKISLEVDKVIGGEEELFNKLDGHLERGELVMVGVGSNYLLEVVRQELPPKEVTDIDFMLSEVNDIRSVLGHEVDFAAIDQKLGELRLRYGNERYEYACLYIAQSVVKYRYENRRYWSIDQEREFSSIIRTNIINKIVPPEFIVTSNLEKDRSRLKIPPEGFSRSDPRALKVPEDDTSHAVLLHGSYVDAQGETVYLLSDPVESFGPNRPVKKRVLYDILAKYSHQELEVLSLVE